MVEDPIGTAGDALAESPPPGFTPHYRRSPLTDPWEPIYSRKTERSVILGLRIAEAHCNGRGFAHGGLITSLADNAMGLSCGQVLAGSAKGLVTVNLTTDFLRSVNIGQWLEVDTTFVKAGASLCFTQAFITADGELAARSNAVFKLL